MAARPPGRAVIAQARAACATLAEHGIAIAAADFAGELARRTAVVKSGGPLHVFELALAWACVQRSEPGILYFERTYFPEASRALRKLKLGRMLADEVLGWMRLELFVTPEGALIATYSGRTDLGSWVRAIAVQEALERARRSRRELGSDRGADLPMPEPELVAMRGAHGAEFTRALSESFQALTAQERTLLRQYFLDGLTIDVLAGLYQIHRATAAGRIAEARIHLVDRVRAALR